MTAPRRWFRLDVTWSSSAWLAELRPGGRLAWVELLAYVKANGVRGRAKALAAMAAGKRWSIPARDVEAMIEAALADDALRIEQGDWIVTGWDTYQPTDETAAERMRRHRDKRRMSQLRARDRQQRHREKKRENTGGSGALRRNTVTLPGVPSRDRDVDVDVDVDITPSPAPPYAGDHGTVRPSAPDAGGEGEISTAAPEPRTPTRLQLIAQAEPVARLGLNRMRGRDDEGDVWITPRDGKRQRVGYGLDLVRWRELAATIESVEPAVLARALWHVVDVLREGDVRPPFTLALVESIPGALAQAIHRALEETPAAGDVIRTLGAHVGRSLPTTSTQEQQARVTQLKQQARALIEGQRIQGPRATA